jgi:hypothetical protein
MNAEVAVSYLSAVWLQNNTTTEQLTRKYIAESEALNTEIREINKARQVLQTKTYPELSKLGINGIWRCSGSGAANSPTSRSNRTC